MRDRARLQAVRLAGRADVVEGRAAMSMEDQATVPRDQQPAQADAHELPHESLAPITLSAGIGLFAFGLLTSPVFSVVGIATMGWALATWIGEMRHG